MTNGQYRLNAGAIVFNKEGKVLVCERVDFENQWQFPQGGIDDGENYLEASRRELFEETNISSVKYIASYPQTLKYDFPPHIVKKFKQMGRTNIGQEQYWFLFLFEGNEKEICFSANQVEKEFNKYQWIDIIEAIDLVVDFKKEVYIKICSYFAPIINDYIKNM